MAGQRVKVLLVEDDEDDFILTRNLLAEIEGTKYELHWVPEFERALEQVCTLPYDACLVDFRLGQHNGIEFVQEAIRRGCVAPLILMTGQGDHEVDLAAMRAGAADYLSKSQISGPMLERSIRYSIEHKRAERQRIEFVQEQTARREAEAANQAKDQFLATLSHELRTPLNAILGWAQLLRLGNLDQATLQQGIDAIERNAKAQAQLIEDLLDVSRIVSGKVRLEMETVTLREVIHAAVDSVRMQAEAKGVQLMVATDESDVRVVADGTRLQQVIWNLLSNAIKFTPKGGEVEARLVHQQHRTQVVVRDTGQGIEPEFLPHVFDRFRQADSSTTRKHTGLGLGLAIVRHLVELHGGSVAVDSAGLGHGSTFTVTLPIAPNACGMNHRPPSENSSGDRDQQLAGLCVMIVDDEPDARAFLAKVLSLYGANVLPYPSVSDAMDGFQQGAPDIIVSDIAMPDEDGYAFLRKVRMFERDDVRQTPAIAITAHASEHYRQQAMESGFNAYLAKPVEPAQLVAVINSLVRQTA